MFRALDYLTKVTVVYFLRVRRGTSQHQSHDTNAGGGGVRRNTRRVIPTSEEEEYVATQDARGGGVCRNTRRVTPTLEEEYVATTVNEYLTLMCFFPQRFLIFFINHLTFFLLLSCVVMTLNISLIRIVYCIENCMSLISSLIFTNIIIKKKN